MAENTEGTATVIVIGGGYAGVMAANRLTQHAGLTVRLINPRPHFVERIRLHQLVCGSDDAVTDYPQVLASDVDLVVDTVERIDAAGRSVTLASGDSIGYDYLICAVGSHSTGEAVSGTAVSGTAAPGTAAPGPAVPGAAEFAHPIATLESARRLRDALAAAPATAAVTVVGAGPTGIETAAELAETSGHAVTLVCGEVLGPYLHPSGRRYVAKHLARLGVSVLQGPGAEVTAVSRDSVRLGDGRTLPSDVTVWTAGFAVPDLARRSALSTDAAGRILTDETLTSVDDPRIIAAGDISAPSGLPLRMSCQAAMFLGAHAADTVLSRIAGNPPTPLDQGFFGQCISLGRRAGIFQLAHKNDTAKRLHISGRPGAKLKEIVCRHIIRTVAGEARKPGSTTWPKDPGRRQLLQSEPGEPGTQVPL
ncbi:FAD-dependent oxidoreductase [Streptomyces sp. NPDC005925]|uniref:NAD(P)/FAD-dependent oxidoreductase n=1 Tax=Streptomyces sp. NPDC005925 TaxID=3157172 RepID=UPI0033F0E467